MQIRKQRKTAGSRFRLMLVISYQRICNFVLGAFQKLLYRRANSPSRILIFRTGSLGDNICAMPAINAIRKKFPQARIDILTNAGKTNLVTLDKLLSPACYDTIIDYLGTSISSLFKKLRKNGYELVVYLPQVDAPFL